MAAPDVGGAAVVGCGDSPGKASSRSEDDGSGMCDGQNGVVLLGCPGDARERTELFPSDFIEHFS